MEARVLDNNGVQADEKWVSAFAYMLRYDDRTLSKRGRKIRNVDFLNALHKYPKYRKMQVTHLSNTIKGGIQSGKKAEDFARVFRNEFGIECNAGDLFGMRRIAGRDLNKFKSKLAKSESNG